MKVCAPSPRLIPKGENRDTPARLVRHPIKGEREGVLMIETTFVRLADAASMLGVDDDNMLLAAAEKKIKAWGLLNEPREAQKVIYDLATTDPPLILEGRLWRPMFVPLSKFSAGDILKHGKGRVGLLTEEDERGAVWRDKEDEPAYITKSAVFFKRDDIMALLNTDQDRSLKASVKPTPTDNSLLGTIAALLAAWPRGNPPSGKDLEKAAQAVGVAITDDTIRKALKAARDIAKGLPPA